MKFKVSLLSLGLLIAGALSAQARTAGDQGYGLVIGVPSGISTKIWFSDIVALDGAFGVNDGDLAAHADLLFHDFTILREHNFPGSSRFDMPLYLGIGPRAIFRDDQEFGVRLPFGISMIPRETPWEFFFELVPVVRFQPDNGLDFDFGIGTRYYFEAIRPRQ